MIEFALLLTIVVVGLVAAGLVAAGLFFGARSWRGLSERFAAAASFRKVSDVPVSPPHLDKVLALRGAIVAGLLLAFTIPLAMIGNLVIERSDRYRAVVSEVGESWGATQSIAGPLLVVPFIDHQLTRGPITVRQGITEYGERLVPLRRYAVFLPETFVAKTRLDPERRMRGIYAALVYRADVVLSGSFAALDLSQFPPASDEAAEKQPRRILWEEAALVLGLSGPHALRDRIEVAWDERPLVFEPGAGPSNLLPQAIHAPIAGKLGPEDGRFSLRLKVNGSQLFTLAPIGATTEVALESPWPHPRFTGRLLPESYETSKDGFAARWRVPGLARAYPQAWVSGSDPGSTDMTRALSETTIAVELYEAGDLYHQLDRATKYGLLFVALTFGTVLLFELGGGVRAHYLQYAMIGGALSLFFMLLLSLSEHLGFAVAFGLSATTVVTLVTLYAAAVLKGRRKALAIGLMLTCLYALLFAILQLLDYALIAGTLVLLAALIVAMWSTRRLGHTAVPTTPAGPPPASAS